MPEEKITKDLKAKNNIMMPIAQGKKIELVGCNFSVSVASTDPNDNLNYMSSLAANLYNHLLKLEGF